MPADVVRATARAFERDRYLSALLAPAEHRDALLAIAAFAGDVARIPTIVTEPMLGEIRLQWWRDTLDALAAGLRSGHPIADALGEAMRHYGLPAGLLHGYVDAQTLGLGEEAPEDDTALAAHFAKTEGALCELAARVLVGEAETRRWTAALRTGGRAYGLARMLVELPALRAERRTLVPASRLAGLKLDAAGFYALTAPGRVGDLVADIAIDARDTLAAVRADLGRAPKPIRLALLPVALVEPYLRASEHRSRDPLREVPELVPLVRVWRLWWAATAGSF